MKTHHPDRFQDEGERHKAEEISKHVIDAYHFLVSIHPETHATNKEDFERTATCSSSMALVCTACCHCATWPTT